MNVLPCEVREGKAFFAGHPVETANAGAHRDPDGRLEIGVRPEFVELADAGIPITIVKVLDIGRHRIVESERSGNVIKMLVPEDRTIPEGPAFVRFSPEQTRVYRNGWMLN
jgi:glycerol transport system ATP-binding protein